MEGKADIVSSDTDGDGAHDTQRFDIDLTGFAPGEDVVFYLITEDGARVRDLFATTADADGRITYTGPVPTDLPAGRYRIVAQGGLYGEGLTSKPIEVTANGWWNVDDGDIPIDPSPSPTADPTTDPAPAAAPIHRLAKRRRSRGDGPDGTSVAYNDAHRGEPSSRIP